MFLLIINIKVNTKRFTKRTNFFNKGKEKGIFLFINGGDLTLKIRQVQWFFCIHEEEIKLYNVIKFCPVVWPLSWLKNPPKSELCIFLFIIGKNGILTSYKSAINRILNSTFTIFAQATLFVFH